MNIVFDWSGTLADDHIITWNITNNILEYLGGTTITFDTYKNEFVIPVDTFYSKYCPNVPINTLNEYFFKNYNSSEALKDVGRFILTIIVLISIGALVAVLLYYSWWNAITIVVVGLFGFYVSMIWINWKYREPLE